MQVSVVSVAVFRVVFLKYIDRWATQRYRRMYVRGVWGYTRGVYIQTFVAVFASLNH